MTVAPDPADTRPQALVVDDDPLFRTLCRAALSERYEVAVASDGHSAVKLALESKPSVVVLDHLMPGWDGLRTLRAIRSETDLDDTIVLIHSASVDETTAEELRDAGADAIETKAAFAPDRLLHTVSTMRPPSGPRRQRSVRRVVPVV